MGDKKNFFYVFGSGGHAKSCIDVILNNPKNIVSAIVCENIEKIDPYFKKFKIVYEKNLKASYKNFYALVGVGQIKSNLIRKKILRKIKKKKFKMQCVISLKSYVSKNSKIFDGTIVMDNVHIGPSCEIGNNCIINTGAIIEHDVTIGNNCHIAPGCIINGGVIISNDCFIGSGTIIKEGIRIKKGSIIPMGSKLIKNV